METMAASGWCGSYLYRPDQNGSERYPCSAGFQALKQGDVACKIANSLPVSSEHGFPFFPLFSIDMDQNLHGADEGVMRLRPLVILLPAFFESQQAVPAGSDSCITEGPAEELLI